MSQQDHIGTGTRARILEAATIMFGEDTGASLSVRSVAARAGVSTGSLRHFFPTQRDLRDAVSRIVYDQVASDDPIHDRSRTPHERLLGSLQQVLATAGAGAEAREAWRRAHEMFIAPEPTEDVRTTYQALEAEGRRRTEHWLRILADEGALPSGADARQAHFLMTVLTGLSFERAAPGEHDLAAETQTLTAAVDAVLGTPSAGTAD